MIGANKELRYYVTQRGNAPAEDWLSDLRDKKAVTIIQTRLDRLALRNPGDHRMVGNGVWELRIHFGPGYRIYYGEDGESLIILLYGGDKSTQNKDIQKAQNFWADYRSR
jgi:putative addiction module killer protein